MPQNSMEIFYDERDILSRLKVIDADIAITISSY